MQPTPGGKLFRIKIKSKHINEITVRGTNLTGGDGLVLNGEQLYVVHTGVVDILKLKSSLRSARLKKTIKDPSFDSPTMAALHNGRALALVRGRARGPAVSTPIGCAADGAVLNP